MSQKIKTTVIEKETDMHNDPPKNNEIKLLIENALLHNNEQLRTNFDASIEKFSVKLATDIATQTKAFADQVFNLTAQVTKHEAKIVLLDGAVKSLKTTQTVVGTVCTTLGGLIGFFIAQLIN